MQFVEESGGEKKKFEVVEMPDKGGKGVRARSAFVAGECISSESELSPDEYNSRFMFNHSCLPNAQSRSDVKGKSNRLVHALRSIEAGEEITISYCPSWWPVEQRKKELLDKFGFACDCAACTNEEVKNAREVQLISCMRLYDMVPMTIQARCPSEALLQAHTRMELLQHAKCGEVEVAQAAHDAAQMAAAAGNEKARLAFARFSYSCRLLALGADATETKEAVAAVAATMPAMPNAVTTPPPQLMVELCAHCGKNNAKARCAICNMRYCDKTCQSTAWALHKKICKAFKNA
jgi:hypothetical protein